MSNPPLFEAKGISKDFATEREQSLHVLDKIDLSLYPNEIVAVIGPSGCGKSTLLRIIAGLIPQSQGQIFYHGKELKGLMPDVSFVFQTFALYPWMTVRENIEMVLKSIHLPVEEIRKKTQEAIELISLTGFEDAYPREISGGMKQRVGMARALVRDPEMLFMDEPFSEVDAFTAETLRDEVLNIWSNKNLRLSSILLVSHDVHEVAYMADRIVVLGKNPATVRAIIENTLPRPRNYRSPEFLKLVDQLHDSYGQIKVPSAKPEPRKEKIGPILYASKDSILGLLRYLQMYGGSLDIFKIGAESNQHFDRVIVVLEASELLNLVETQYRSATITPKGKEFVSGNDKARRKIWKEELLTIPLFIKIIDLLQKDPQRALGREAIVEFLQKELPHQDAYTQFNILVRWGRYSGLFTYHKKYKYLSLNS